MTNYRNIFYIEIVKKESDYIKYISMICHDFSLFLDNTANHWQGCTRHHKAKSLFPNGRDNSAVFLQWQQVSHRRWGKAINVTIKQKSKTSNDQFWPFSLANTSQTNWIKSAIIQLQLFPFIFPFLVRAEPLLCLESGWISRHWHLPVDLTFSIYQ